MHLVLRGACAAFLAGWTAACSASAQTSGSAGTAPAQSSAATDPATPAAKPVLPRVHLVATGGTISNRDGGRLTADELAKSMPGRGPRRHPDPRAVRQRVQQPDHPRPVAAAVAPHQRALRRGPRPGRRGRDQRHRYARGDGVLPAPHDTRRPPGRGGRLDAQSEHPGLRGRGQPAGGRAGRRRAVGARQGRAGGAERRDQLRPRRHQDRRAAAADLPEPDARPARRGRSRPGDVLPADPLPPYRDLGVRPDGGDRAAAGRRLHGLSGAPAAI